MTDAQQAPRPRRVEMSDDGRAIMLTYADEPPVTLTAEFLRVFSPSAEVVGHAPGQEVADRQAQRPHPGHSAHRPLCPALRVR